MLLDLRRAGFRVPEFICSPPDLPRAVARLGVPLAVRSSASVEDGRSASFAGQFRSYLNLRSLAEVAEAVCRCRESVGAPRVAAYCGRNGIDPRSLRMDVILQRMVHPEIAGVAFTVNPVTGAEEVVIEACRGTAQDLLAGRSAPLPRDHRLLMRHAPEIERVARRIQRRLGVPQDIEFAIEGGKLYILQARPITQIGFEGVEGEWTNADFRDGGVASGVCTPLMWSLYDLIWEAALKGFLREIRLLDRDFQAGRMFYGRPYWNLGEVKRCLARLPGFLEREFDEDLSVQVDYQGDGRRTPSTLPRILRALPSFLAIARALRGQERFDRRFLAGGFEALVRGHEEAARDPEAALRALVEGPYRVTETSYFRTIFCASLAKLDLKRSFPEAGDGALVAALPELKHLEPARALREMASRGETDLTGFLGRFRHHSRRELDIRCPRWDEDLEWVERMLDAQCGAAGTDPRPTHLHARAAALARLPWWRRGSFGRKLDRLRTFLWLREEMRDLSSRVYYLIRRRVLEVARRRGLGDDVFFMTYGEVLAGDRSSVWRRREVYEGYRSFRAPNEIGARFAGPEPGSPEPAPRALRGIAASPGTACGTARVALSVEEAIRSEKGAILVCPFTDPGWTPVLDRVAGVVTETGGFLSHAAVICREFGIPAVLGVPGATRRIPDGAAVVLRGSEGQVELAG